MSNINKLNETPKEVEYYRCLQLKIFADCIHDRQPYTDVAECFTDVDISEQEYNAVLNNPTTVERFIKSKGYRKEYTYAELMAIPEIRKILESRSLDETPEEIIANDKMIQDLIRQNSSFR